MTRQTEVIALAIEDTQYLMVVNPMNGDMRALPKILHEAAKQLLLNLVKDTFWLETRVYSDNKGVPISSEVLACPVADDVLLTYMADNDNRFVLFCQESNPEKMYVSHTLSDLLGCTYTLTVSLQRVQMINHNASAGKR